MPFSIFDHPLLVHLVFSWNFFLLVACGFIVVYFYVFYARTKSWASSRRESCPFDAITDKLLLIIAHPDDESMFFGPALLALKKHNIPTFILCLCNGNHYGLGLQRENELIESARVLGISADRVRLINSGNLSDGDDWKTGDILPHVNIWIEKWGISQILTFDEYGVSGHLNHIAIAVASCQFPVPVWQLCSLSVVQKYFPLLINLQSDWSIHVSNSDISRIRRAMTQHRTQMVWFRWIYIFTSVFIRSNWIKRI